MVRTPPTFLVLADEFGGHDREKEMARFFPNAGVEVVLAVVVPAKREGWALVVCVVRVSWPQK